MVNAEGCQRGCWIKEGGRGSPPTKAPDGKTVPPASHNTKTSSLCCCRWPPAFSWMWRCLGAGPPGSQRRRKRGAGTQSPGSRAASVTRRLAGRAEGISLRPGRGRRQRPLVGERGGHCFSRAAENYLVGEGWRGQGAAHQSLLLYFAINVKQSQKKLLFLSLNTSTLLNRQVSQ